MGFSQPRHHIKKQRHYFANKGLSSQSYGFSNSHIWMWEWTIKKAEHRRIDAFELWCWRRLLRVPWTARRSNQSILKEISPEYSLEGLMLKLKLQYFGHLMQKTLMLGKIEGGRRWGRQRVRWLDGITNSVDMNLSRVGKIVEDRGAWHTAACEVTKSRTRFTNWTTTTIFIDMRAVPFLSNLFEWEHTVVIIYGIVVTYSKNWTLFFKHDRHIGIFFHF